MQVVSFYSSTRWWFFLCGCLFLSVTLQAQNVLGIRENLIRQNAAADIYFSIWKDSTLQAAWATVSQPAFQKNFQKPQSLNLGRQKDAIWIKLQVYNPRKETLRIAFQNVFFDSLTLYQPWAEQPELRKVLNGDAVIFHQRLVQEILPSYDLIPHPLQDTTTYYFRMVSTSRIQINAQVGSVNSLRSHYYRKYLVETLIYGILLAIIFYNLFILLSTKLQAYAAYLLLTISFALNYLDLGGYSILFASGDIRNFISIFTHGAVGNAGIIFIIFFLRVRENSTFYYRILSTLLYFNSALLVASCFTLNIHLQNTIQLFGLFIIPSLLLTGVHILRKGFILARFYLLGLVTYIFFVLIYYAKLYGFIESNLFVEYSVQLGTVLETFIFSFALADMLNVMRLQRDKMQQDLLNSELAVRDIIKNQNQLLEKTVVEKTQALQVETEALKNTTLQLKEANALKDRLFNIISHDLRSPLNTLASLLELFKNDKPLSEEQLQDVFKQLGVRLKANVDLLDNLLRWSMIQISQGQLVVNLENIHLLSLVNETVELASLIARKKGISFQVGVSDQLHIQADKQLMMLILRNLLQNAIKFSPSHTTIEIKMLSLHNNRVKIIVKDQGVGIPANKLATIFELGYHKKTVGTAQEVGSGLGLFLVRESVVAQGGCIEIDSTPGQGTVIGFTVAQAPQAQTLA